MWDDDKTQAATLELVGAKCSSSKTLHSVISNRDAFRLLLLSVVRPTLYSMRVKCGMMIRLRQ